MMKEIFFRSGFSRWEAGKAQIWTASVGLLGALVALCLDSEVSSLLTIIALFSISCGRILI